MKPQHLTRGKRAVDTAVRYIKQNYASPLLSLENVAEMVDLTPQYFSKVFKQTTGELFINFVTRIRIDVAKVYLTQQRDTKIYEISAAVGYLDQGYFSQIFRKMTGYTPVQYRSYMVGIVDEESRLIK